MKIAGMSFLMFTAWALAWPMAADASHEDRFSEYQGTQTCLECHQGQARQVHDSVHYQWLGSTSRMTNPPAGEAGKLGGINDFCIYPDINWLGKLTNQRGEEIDGGCAQCHVGQGAKPGPTSSDAELANIDCLICHSDAYRRTVVVDEDGPHFQPDEAAMGMTATEAAWQVGRPSNASCLKCHAKGGGGDNHKRGDMSLAMINPSRDLDVHLASKSSGGAGLSCLDCHQVSSHRFAGRGVDLRPVDNPAAVSCLSCHGQSPHDQSDLNRHTGRVGCATCHVPSFARNTPTEMVRDWGAPGDLVQSSGIIEPHGDRQSNVTPSYGFFNGKSTFYNFGTAASGKVVMAAPAGNINDGMLIPMKVHQGRQPRDPQTKKLLPIKIGVFFQTGDLAEAVRQGVDAVGWPQNGYEMADTMRYMGIFHQVAPANQALSCNQCHGGGRIDFASLGYTPKQTRNGAPLCQSCHGDRSEDLEGDYFREVHAEHVGEEGFDCSSCHNFSASITQPAGTGGGGDDDHGESEDDEKEDKDGHDREKDD